MRTLNFTGLLWAMVFGIAVARAFAGEQELPGRPSNHSAPFPEVNEVLQGRAFSSNFDRDVFFLRRIRDSYPSSWEPLLKANITVADYLAASSKLRRFVEELGAAMENRNDAVACTNLALIVSSPEFYANTNVYHPEVIRTAAQSLIKIGPSGRRALAKAFTEDHYRTDSVSLEELAKVVGAARIPDDVLPKALEQTAFSFATQDGANYPRCTRTAVENLLRLTMGPELVATHLSLTNVLSDPGRFQAIVEGIAAVRATSLATNLVQLEPGIVAKLTVLTNSPGAYRDEVEDLRVRIQRAVLSLQQKPSPR
jgi:hypothetical protein